jgi:hypothetical protein
VPFASIHATFSYDKLGIVRTAHIAHLIRLRNFVSRTTATTAGAPVTSSRYGRNLAAVTANCRLVQADGFANLQPVTAGLTVSGQFAADLAANVAIEADVVKLSYLAYGTERTGSTKETTEH